jgi:hypothetical protein
MGKSMFLLIECLRGNDSIPWGTFRSKRSTLMSRPAVFSPNQCVARSKRSGERCKNFALRGRSCCKFHGGRSRRGKAHPNYKTGVHCKDAKEAAKILAHFLERPIDVKVVLSQEHGQRVTSNIVFPNEYGQLLPTEELRVLRATMRQLGARCKELVKVLESS